MAPRTLFLEAPTLFDLDTFSVELAAARAADATSDMPNSPRPNISLAWQLNETGRLESRWTPIIQPTPKERATHTDFGIKTKAEFLAEYEGASLGEMATADAAWMERQMTAQEKIYPFLGSISSHREAVKTVNDSGVIGDTLRDMRMSTYRFKGREYDEVPLDKQRVAREAELMRKDMLFEAKRIATAEGITTEEAWNKVDRVKLFGEYDLDDIFLDVDYHELVPTKPVAQQPASVVIKPRQTKKSSTFGSWDDTDARLQRVHDGLHSPLSERVGGYVKFSLITATSLGWIAAGYGGAMHLLEKYKDKSEFAAAIVNLFQ